MSQPTSIEDAIDRNAKGPSSATVAGQTVTTKSIDELIKADQYLAAKAAVKRQGFGIRVGQIINRSCG